MEISYCGNKFCLWLIGLITISMIMVISGTSLMVYGLCYKQFGHWTGVVGLILMFLACFLPLFMLLCKPKRK